MCCYENRYGPCLTTQTRTDGRKTGYYTRKRSPWMARRVKLSIVKIGEFHTDTRFGKEEKKKAFSNWESPISRQCVVLGRVSGRILVAFHRRSSLTSFSLQMCANKEDGDLGNWWKRNSRHCALLPFLSKRIDFCLKPVKLHSKMGRNNSRFLTYVTHYKSAIYQVSQLLRQRQNVDNKWACQRVKNNELLWHFWMNNKSTRLLL